MVSSRRQFSLGQSSAVVCVFESFRSSAQAHQRPPPLSSRGNCRIRRVNIASGSVTTVAGDGSSMAYDGVGTSASFNRPYGITMASDHLLYVFNYNSNK
eukprot:4594109-Prymnesium_polylepis.1